MMNHLNRVLTDKIFSALASNDPKITTPCYIFDASVWIERYNFMKEALGTELVYSLKANPNKDLLNRIHHVGYYKEVASQKELSELCPDASAIFVNNPSMDVNFIRSAIASQSTIIVDSIEQLKTIEQQSAIKQPKPLILRLNGCVIQDYFPEHRVRQDHFGMDLTTAFEAIDIIKAAENLSLDGFHLFLGSHTYKNSSANVVAAAPKILDAIEERYGKNINLVNLGGGFSENWPEDQDALDAYKESLKNIPSRIKIFHESGRGIYACCGAFITTVVRTKSINGQDYAICNGGLNQNFLLGKTENRFSSPQIPVIYRKDQESKPDTETVKTLLVGSTCSRDDVIGAYEGPPLREGDQCIFLNCGAYNSTYTVSNFLGLQEPKFYVFP